MRRLEDVCVNQRLDPDQARLIARSSEERSLSSGETTTEKKVVPFSREKKCGENCGVASVLPPRKQGVADWISEAGRVRNCSSNFQFENSNRYHIHILQICRHARMVQTRTTTTKLQCTDWS